jgi:hypothetical protein
MSPPSIYPQLPHFHNHGLAIPFHFISKEIFEVFFSSFIIKIPNSSKRWSIEKREREREREKVLKKEEGKEKLQESLQIKRGSQYIERRKNILTSKSFYVSPFSPAPSYYFQNPFQNRLRKFHSFFWTIHYVGNMHGLSCILSLYP